MGHEGYSSWFDRNLGHHHIFSGLVAGLGGNGGDGTNHVHAFGNLAEDSVAAIQTVLGAIADVELGRGAVGALASGHAHGPIEVAEVLAYLQLDSLSRSASACSLGTAGLHDKAFYHSMEYQPVVEVAFSQLDEVGGSNGGLVLMELELDGAEAGFQHGDAIRGFVIGAHSDEENDTPARAYSQKHSYWRKGVGGLP